MTTEDKNAGPRTINGVYFIGSLIVIVLSIPLIMKWIGPNGLYGYRVAKTMNNPDIWYRANSVLGVDLLIAGILILLTTLFVYNKGKSFTIGRVVLVDLLATVLTLGAALAHSAFTVSSM
jgi:hypothetical protein